MLLSSMSLSTFCPTSGIPMSLLGGEHMVFQAPELRCCNSCNRGAVRNGEDTPLTKDTGIMLTDRRIVFHWVRKVLFCLPSTEQEESFAYSVSTAFNFLHHSSLLFYRTSPSA